MIVLTPQMMQILSDGGWLWVYGKTIRLHDGVLEEWVAPDTWRPLT